ncbi:DUF3857 domain-containing transglutaminase family protein [Rhizorhabdus sp. FW153]|uniref:DUF3857 domain-containing transglutaminase family protein n=1 Tax=Rhizorhabdus sp. FW153 TaxID=3400216 RepID=UPI003CEDB2B7
MSRVIPTLIAAAVLAGGACPLSAWAAPAGAELAYGPAASWIAPPPPPTTGRAPPDAAYRLVYQDGQVRITDKGEEIYSAYRVKILKSDGLSFGKMSLMWNPSSGSATIHTARLVRDGQSVDLLKANRFQVLQREDGLEESMLDGMLTAVLQAPGLRIGDEVEFAYTTTDRDPTLGEHGFGFGSMMDEAMPGAFRFTLRWSNGRPMRWQASRDLPQAVPVRTATETVISYELRDPSGVILNDGAPGRYNIRRTVGYSEFKDWREVSRRMAPLYDKVSVIPADSPLQAEVARIAAATGDPAERAQAALRLVQDEIRYVYVGLDGGNFRPASVAETWERRFGDCKAKTVLLSALLRALGIDAEPVLVNTDDDDGLDQFLPSPALFDHVLVRARIGGASYLLDGTRSGDRYLDQLPQPDFHWALPVRAVGADLEPVTSKAPDWPEPLELVEIDASAGPGGLARLKARTHYRGEAALDMLSRLSGGDEAANDRSLKSLWQKSFAWLATSTVSWSYDERANVLTMRVEGQGHPAWEQVAGTEPMLEIPWVGFEAPKPRRRPHPQDRSIPWTTEGSFFSCSVTSIRLPPEEPGWHWASSAVPMRTQLGENLYWRRTDVRDGVMTVVASHRVEQAEVTAEQVATMNAYLSGFDDNIPFAFKAEGRRTPDSDPGPRLPSAGDARWDQDQSACRPTRRSAD